METQTGKDALKDPEMAVKLMFMKVILERSPPGYCRCDQVSPGRGVRCKEWLK